MENSDFTTIFALQNFLARNMRQLEMATLGLAFLINMILLFHRVNVIEDEDEEDGSGEVDISEEYDGDDDDDEPLEEVFLASLPLPYGYELSGFWLGKVN